MKHLFLIVIIIEILLISCDTPSGEVNTDSSSLDTAIIDDTTAKGPFDTDIGSADDAETEEPADDSSGRLVDPERFDESMRESESEDDTIARVLYYEDFDKDGFGDPSKPKESTRVLDNYSLNSLDNCPTRSGPEENGGCPQVKILIPSANLFVGDGIELSIDKPMAVTDEYYWYTGGNVIVSNARTLNPEFNFSSIGKYTIQLEIKNASEGYYSGKIVSHVFVKIEEGDYAKLFDPLIKYGNYAFLEGRSVSDTSKIVLSNELKEEMYNAEIRLSTLAHKDGVSVFKSGMIENDYKNLIDELRSVKRSSGTRIRKIGIANIQYDSVNGKIVAFDYVLER